MWRGQKLAQIANSSWVIWSDLSIYSELLDLFHLLLFSEFTWRSWLSYFSELASCCLPNVSCFLFTQNVGIRLLYDCGTHQKDHHSMKYIYLIKYYIIWFRWGIILINYGMNFQQRWGLGIKSVVSIVFQIGFFNISSWFHYFWWFWDEIDCLIIERI